MVNAICLIRRVFPASDGAPEPTPWAHRDYEWFAKFRCPMCRHKTLHHFIEWLPERVVTARCGACGFEGTL
jgi:hypothetical protein